MHCFISPHFDDAVGSCGGYMAALVAVGEAVCVVTVFTGQPKKLSSFARKLHELWGVHNDVTARAAENAEACGLLGVQVVGLGFVEAIYRLYDGRVIYSCIGDILGSISKSDERLPCQIATQLDEIVSGGDTLYFPIGRGGHVDHLLVRRSSGLLSRKVETRYYLDFSYEGWLEDKGFIMHEESFTQSCFERKKEAVRRYRSQLEMLFGAYGGLDAYYEKENHVSDYWREIYFIQRHSV